MSRRIDKKRQKQAAQVIQTPAAPCEAAPAQKISFYIQYQNEEYLESEIVARITEQCKADGASEAELAELSVYLKPEDRKAYYTYNGKNGVVDL